MLGEREITTGLGKLAAEVEPAEKLWEHIRRDMKRERPRRIQNGVTAAAVIAALVVTGAGALSSPAIARFFAAHQPNPLEIAAAHPVGGEQGAPPTGGTTVTTQPLTLSKAKQMVEFDIALPQYLPKGASLVSVQLIDDSGKMDARNQRVLLRYESSNDALTLQQWKTHPLLTPYDPRGNSVETKVGDRIGWFWEYQQDGTVMRALMWEDRGFSYVIHSTMPKEEIIRVAGSVGAGK